MRPAADAQNVSQPQGLRGAACLAQLPRGLAAPPPPVLTPTALPKPAPQLPPLPPSERSCDPAPQPLLACPEPVLRGPLTAGRGRWALVPGQVDEQEAPFRIPVPRRGPPIRFEPVALHAQTAPQQSTFSVPSDVTILVQGRSVTDPRLRLSPAEVSGVHRSLWGS